MDNLVHGVCSFWSSSFQGYQKGFGLTGRCTVEEGGGHRGPLGLLVPGLHWNVWVEGMHGLFVWVN